MRLLSVALVAALCLCASRAIAFEAGAAKVEITPPVGTPLNGYGARQARASVGVHDPLWARCLYLDDGQTDVFIINTDLVFINPELRARVLELAPDGVVRDRIILTATHTHYAQGAMCKTQPLRYVAGRFEPEILEMTAAGIAKSMEEAMKAKQRAAIGYGVIQQKDLTVNRRFKDGPIDEQIGIILVEDADGDPISVVANMAAHPTSVPDDFMYHVSADFPGFFYQEMETLTSANCVPLFLNGAEGDQTISSPEGTGGWERTEKVGRLLAQRIKEALDKIECREEALYVGYSEPVLPVTVAEYLQPERTVLHTLEIGGLLMCFFPGEPCVELGIEMRRRALETGYTANFSVGLSNDYLNYFVPPDLYDDLIYENAMNFFGPRISDYFYHEFENLMTKKPQPQPGPEPQPVQVDEVAGVRKLTLTGTAYERGFQRGKAEADELTRLYHERVVTGVSSGAFLPTGSPWNMLPGFIDPTPLALPVLAIGARPRLSSAAPWQREAVTGMADGAGLPFDAVWLLQAAPVIPGYEDKSALYNAPLCTMVAFVGEQASGGLLVGRNLDWHLDETPTLIEESGPDTLRTLQVGFTWNAGAYTGMNEKGVFAAVQRFPHAPPPAWNETPLDLHAARILAEATDLPTALKMLQEVRATHGVVLVAGPTEKGPQAAVVHFDGAPRIRYVEKGFATAVNVDDPLADPDTKARYTRMDALAAPIERALPGDVMQLMDDVTGEGEQRIRNEHTVHSVVFEPAKKTLHVAFPDAAGGPNRYTAITFEGGKP